MPHSLSHNRVSEQYWDNSTYAGTNITGVTGLTEAQRATLLALGAVES